MSASSSSPARSVYPQWHTHGEYRPDVDGLRAVAVLAVIVFHGFPKLLTGGFAGVDVFFVISGFLISGIILRALERGDFTLLGFYARRVKRIFPALITILVAVWVLGAITLLSNEYKIVGKHIAAGGGFMMNLVLFADTKAYFGAINTPLIHLWSLGVEEQFYLLWPLLLFGVWKLSKGRFIVIALIALASFLLNVLAISSSPISSFYLPSSRLWELASGGLLAYLQLNGEVRLKPIRAALSAAWPATTVLLGRHVRGAVGFILVLLSFAGLNEDTAFPGWWALAPCIGSFLLISAGPQSWVNRHILSQPWMVFIGLISYPLYLWHWPLLSFAHTSDWRGFTTATILGVIAISFVLAFLTYKYIETPIRRSPQSGRLASALCGGMAVCTAVGYLTFIQVIPARPEPAEVSRFARAAAEKMPFPKEEGFLTVGTGERRVLLIGDSTLSQYHPRIARILSDKPPNARSAVFAWRAGCAPDMAMSLVDPPACQKLLDDAVEYAKDPSVDAVVIGFAWYAYFAGILDPERVGTVAPLVPGSDRALDNIRKMAAGFTAAGKQVYILLSLPVDPGFPPRQMIRRTLTSGFQLDIRSPSRAQVARAVDPFVPLLIQIAEETGAKVIDPMDSLCDSSTCPAVSASGEPIYRDSWHLRASYIEENVTFLDSLLLETATAAEGGHALGGRPQ